ncbi:MAG: hypothetical protein UU02_C0057G0004 [Candidatus Woesebacteria bacterium GW2011_GWA1_40_43]|uniref:TACO1/YebC-like N-terminal domain-containing protein n=1 Tax=Candidatus Woesebacteria bacterium GW2011_GWA1_40_43 TaxID=1618553 RepID=A0A0G0SGR0_9BACT|nr:MAG: hypothetical protein UU02_C0057G0004 [Candidatus Woesebacteria bacterium GW2011_GWA1_40_43]
MSGHSHFATIKRQKAVNDAAKGNLFSKMARAIMIAAKSGGDPDMNFKLRFEIDKARAVSMPKENIERAIAKATTEAAIKIFLIGQGGVWVAQTPLPLILKAKDLWLSRKKMILMHKCFNSSMPGQRTWKI